MSKVVTNEGAILDVHFTWFCGDYVATCERCGIVIVTWDDEDELQSHLCCEER